MKLLRLLVLFMFSVALYAQTVSPAPAAPAQTTRNSQKASTVSALITSELDTKKAKAGDAVEAKTTRAITLADGVKLPRGTMLAGHITAVHARSKNDKTSYLAFTLDHAVLHGGSSIPLHITVTALSAPSDANASAAMDSMSAGDMSLGRGGSYGNSAAIGRTAQNPTGAPGATATGSNGSYKVGALTGNVNDPKEIQLDHLPVANMAGMTFSSAGTTVSLEATGTDLYLDVGFRLMLLLSADH